MSADVQRANVRQAAAALADLARNHDIVVAHGSGPQVGLLALQAAALTEVPPYPLDVISAESIGMIGYMIEQELANVLPPATRLATLLTHIEVERDDPAFSRPEKPIGPIYTAHEAENARAAHGWPVAEEAPGRWRRVVSSPLPKRIVQIEVIRMLVTAKVVTICAGGGGIPVVRDAAGDLQGVEAVIDKDRAAGLLAADLAADAFLMLTDVDAVYLDWGTPQQRPVRRARPAEFAAHRFPPGSMGPKVEAACQFAATPGRIAGIGRLQDARAILEGNAGTTVISDEAHS
ncbi:putative carbamate kinase [Bosea sp. 62]|nr:carbamate kinase [Hansschlegelia zhihuaiae]CAD5291291.1 putative carbamate kinase [Bosea sp. 21B]CAD5292471.1 putative carbamate kinase [Bosea sp. 46]CAD5300150.1 putative carbamate kinase [Bosea sp. 7B]VVT57223.1 putative carbamate kinase [Bosea sp. EC-HK365B]VXB51352.1 putative carbamate kinase [Bosea sp. 127]VXC68452.1 putative carbamate kinase [Bosea sp. 29B]VXC68668.1 putative carbamate kinase [Bosea sp. 125]VXC96158.1 putative carbamate kinase [Bosea sp. 62]